MTYGSQATNFGVTIMPHSSSLMSIDEMKKKMEKRLDK